MSQTYFISGIDTDAGKSYATGWLARKLMTEGKKVITQKFIQTGNIGKSEDIEIHRRIMGTGLLAEDIDLTTAPVIFSYPASAQLAARIDGCEIDLDIIDNARKKLENCYDVVLVEGAGGLMVPITDDFYAIDYAATRNLPVILVTNSRLGSINHTILALEAIRNRNMRLDYVLYNTHFDSDKIIAADTRGFIKRYITRYFHDTEILDIPDIGNIM